MTWLISASAGSAPRSLRLAPGEGCCSSTPDEQLQEGEALALAETACDAEVEQGDAAVGADEELPPCRSP